MRQDHPADFAKLVFDETSLGSDAARSRSLRTFMHSTNEGRCWNHVLDVPFFVSSSITPGIQLADIMAGALRHHEVLRESGSAWNTPWEAAILELRTLAARKSHDFAVGADTYYGLYRMPDRYYQRPPGARPF
jgi:hypothetical protein